MGLADSCYHRQRTKALRGAENATGWKIKENVCSSLVSRLPDASPPGHGKKNVRHEGELCFQPLVIFGTWLSPWH